MEAGRALASISALAPAGWGGHGGGAREQRTTSCLLPGNLVPVPKHTPGVHALSSKRIRHSFMSTTWSLVLSVSKQGFLSFVSSVSLETLVKT